jgi:ribosomal protein L36
MVLTEVEDFYTLITFMKISSSLKSLKGPHPDCQVVRRQGSCVRH